MEPEKPHTNFLPEQSSVKVVLNGGKPQLDSATVPVTYGFNEEVRDKMPTHVLIIDRSEDDVKYDRNESNHTTRRGKRMIFKLNQPIQFVQFISPGVHHLIFIFLKELYEKDEKKFLKRDGSYYQHMLWYSDLNGERDTFEGQVAYAEKFVEIPEAFFARRPQTKVSKAIYWFGNLWFKHKPEDQCDLRRRILLTFIPKLIALPIWYFLLMLWWIVFFIVRIIIALFVTIIVKGFVELGGFFIGFQANSFGRWKWFGKLWSSYIFKKEADVDECPNPGKDLDWDDYKTYTFGKKEIHVWMSPLAFTIQVTLQIIFWTSVFKEPSNWVSAASLFGICVNLWPVLATWRPADDPKEISGGTAGLISAFAFALFFLPWLGYNLAVNWVKPEVATHLSNSATSASTLKILAGLIVLLLLVKFRKKVWKNTETFLSSGADYISDKLEEQRKLRLEKERISGKPNKVERKRIEYRSYLDNAYNIKQTPEKIDLTHIPKAASVTGNIVQKFTVSFWTLKAKVCKPYAK